MLMTQDWVYHLAVARWTVALFWRIFVDRKTVRIDAQFYKLSGLDVPLYHIRGTPKMLGVRGVHCDTVD